MKNIIYYFTQKYLGNWKNIYNAIYAKESVDEQEIKSLKINLDFICISEDNYLNKFKQMYMPPFCLFYKGNLDLLNKKIFGILGSLTKKDFNFILNLKEKYSNNFVFCILENEKNYEIINQLVENKVDLIILVKTKINDKQNVNKNILYLSEFCTAQISVDEYQCLDRILYSLVDNIFVKKQDSKKSKWLYHYIVNDYGKNIFLLNNENNLKVFESIKTNKNNIRLINNFNDILTISKS